MAFAGDLLDRSKLEHLPGDVTFGNEPADAEGADVVVLDLAHHRDSLARVRSVARGAHLVVYGRHTDTHGLQAAREAGADEVMPRSKFFADPAGVVSKR